MSSLFNKPTRMLPADAAVVANRRLGDARALVDTQDDERASGAMYLAGLALEILLKGQVIRLHPILEQVRRPSDAPMSRLHDLVWRHHDLEGLVAVLPDLLPTLEGYDDRTGSRTADALLSVAGAWTIFARYSAVSAGAAEARAFVESIELLRKVMQ